MKTKNLAKGKTEEWRILMMMRQYFTIYFIAMVILLHGRKKDRFPCRISDGIGPKQSRIFLAKNANCVNFHVDARSMIRESETHTHTCIT